MLRYRRIDGGSQHALGTGSNSNFPDRHTPVLTIMKSPPSSVSVEEIPPLLDKSTTTDEKKGIAEEAEEEAEEFIDFLQNGSEAAINLVNADKHSVLLHRASRKNHYVIAGLLVSLGANIEARDASGCTPLSWAACLGHGQVGPVFFNMAPTPLPATKKLRRYKGTTPL